MKTSSQQSATYLASSVNACLTHGRGGRGLTVLNTKEGSKSCRQLTVLTTKEGSESCRQDKNFHHAMPLGKESGTVFYLIFAI